MLEASRGFVSCQKQATSTGFETLKPSMVTTTVAKVPVGYPPMLQCQLPTLLCCRLALQSLITCNLATWTTMCHLPACDTHWHTGGGAAFLPVPEQLLTDSVCTSGASAGSASNGSAGASTDVDVAAVGANVTAVLQGLQAATAGKCRNMPL